MSGGHDGRMRSFLRVLLGLALVFAGTSHLTFARLNRRDAFGLDSDVKRIGRLFGQPLLVAASLWSTRGR